MVLPLARYGHEVGTVFDLLGRSENDLTAALSYGFAHSPSLLAMVLGLDGADADDAILRLETADTEGRTDLEVDTPRGLWIVEAKRGWNLPPPRQLRKYAHRIAARGAGAMFTLSDCSTEWASRPQHLPPAIDGVSVNHVPWLVVRSHIAARARCARGAERTWLHQLDTYLRRAIKVRDAADSWVYCVVVSNTRPAGGGASTFFDFIDKQGVYFHRWGAASRWPKTPPNFLAFRWSGKVQRVHRVLEHEVVMALQERWVDIPVTEGTARPHVVYRLGPRLRFDPLPNGRKIFPSMRLWVLLDQLLTCESLMEAKEQSDALTASVTRPDT